MSSGARDRRIPAPGLIPVPVRCGGNPSPDGLRALRGITRGCSSLMIILNYFIGNHGENQDSR